MTMDTRGAHSGGLTGIVVRGAGLAASGFVLTNVLTLGFYLALARLATPEEFGILAAGSVLVVFSLNFVESGMAAALIRRRDSVEEAANTALVATVAAGVIFAVLALAAAPVIGLFFGSTTITAVAAVMSGTLVIRSLAIVPDALLQKRFSFVRRVVIGPAGVLGFGVAAVVATAHGWGVWGLVLGSYVSASVEAVLSWIFVRWRPDLRRASFTMWRNLANFGRHILLASLVMNAGEKADSVIIGRLIGTSALGQYRYALRVAGTPLGAIVNAGAYVLYPAFASIAFDDDRFRGAFLRALRWLSIGGLPTSLILLPLGEPLVVLAFGERWRPAGQVAAAMCAFTAGHLYDSLASETWKAAGTPERLPRMHVLSALSLIGLMLVLLPLGLTGMGLALSLSSILVAMYAMQGAARVLDIPVRLIVDEIWPPAVASVAMVAVLLPLDRVVVHADAHGTGVGLALVSLEALAGAIVFLAFLTAIRPARAAELRRLFRGLRHRRSRASAVSSVSEEQRATPTPRPPR